MALTSYFFGNAIKNAFKKKIDWDNDTIKVALLTAAAAGDISQDTWEHFSDITHEHGATGTYVAGGKALTVVAASYDAPSNTIKFDAQDLTWPASTLAAQFAVIYDATEALPANQPLISYIDFGEVKTSSSGDFTIEWSADGALKCVVA